MPELATSRLKLRSWREGDLAPFAALNADPQVMRYLGAPLGRARSDELAAAWQARLASEGCGIFVLERAADGAFLGCCGLAVPGFTAHFTPCTEILWRLARAHWGFGYATEAARACLRLAFGELGLAEVVAFTVSHNTRSRAVMERLHMTHDPGENFAHPRLSADHPLSAHVLYRARRPAHGAGAAAG